MTTNDTAKRPLEILMVEDSSGDVIFTREAMKEAKVANRLSVVTDGIDAMAFLRQEGRFANVPRPDLILLDLNLPKKDGREVLAEVKADPDLRSIPVVVLTTSHAKRDVECVYNLHANCFITKPVELDEFMSVIRQINDFWTNNVTLPRRA
jgi:CheY-like chemotaxis protein